MNKKGLFTENDIEKVDMNIVEEETVDAPGYGNKYLLMLAAGMALSSL